ncbi:MAG: S8 family serine peptidase [Acidobacteria bacterium]|nr:S8 family serine peptidase [Acidobacteriota bacterium]
MKTAFRSACVMTVLAIAILALTSAHGYMSQQDARTAAMNKIAPWVMERTAGGAQAEFLVVLNDQADLSRASGLRSKVEKGSYVRNALWNKAQATQGPIIQLLKERGIEYRSFYIVNMIWVKADQSVALELASRSDVARIEGNPAVQNKLPEPTAAIDTPQRPESPDAIEPGINYTRAPEVWAQGFNGQGIVVGGADTGYRWDHNALKNHYRGWNGATANHDFNWHDSVHTGGGTCGANSVVPCDDNFHGTHTMGTAIGDDGAGNQIGMAPGAKWIGCRNMNQGVGTPASYMECFEFFLAPYPVGGTPAQGNPAMAPDLTTNSWSCPTSEGCSPGTLQAGVEAQRAAGIMMVVAAGNSGSACSTVTDPPGIYDASYTVGALTTGTDTLASFSSRGPVTVDGSGRPKPDISAPGTSTRSATNSSITAYTTASGTSMATPHVAGSIALLWSAQPGLTNKIAQTEVLLDNASVHLSTASCSSTTGILPNNLFGYGRLDIRSAVDQALRYAVRPFDLDGDGKTDYAIYRPNGDGNGNGKWFILNGASGTNSQQLFGLATDAPVPGDYNGDGISEIAVFRGSEGAWYISQGSAQSFTRIPWGAAGDVPVPGDYDGDAKTDVAVWRPSTGTWYVLRSSDGGVIAQPFGASGDMVVPGDYDGDGKTDLAVFRPSNNVWYIFRTTNGSLLSVQWGVSGDKLVQGYYDADSKLDIAVWRPSNGTWYILRSTTNNTAFDSIQWGQSGDIPAAGDFEADGKYDVGVFRPSTGQWYVRRSSNGALIGTPWGQSGDRPALSAYVPQ